MSENKFVTIDVEKNVKNCYSTWGKTYYDDYYGPDASYPPVHLNLIKSIVNDAGAKRILDAGCGPASMLRHLAEDNRDLYGFDLTPEMVSEAKIIMGNMGISGSRVWGGSILDSTSFFCEDEDPALYDAVISCGVFPHLSEIDEVTAIRNIYNSLEPDGIAVVEARNEFFSLFSLNRYTYEFFMEKLIPVNDLHQNASEDESSLLDDALAGLKASLRTELPPIRRGKSVELGYDEVLSRLHNPLKLERIFKDVGFRSVETLFYHFHCLPPQFSESVKNLFLQQSLELEKNPRDWRGYFMASAFCILAKK